MDAPKIINILLIEDNPGDARLMAEMLKEVKNFNYLLHFCESLKSGIEFLGNDSTDVILLDLNLPDSSGEETFKTIHSAFPDIPVILISGLGDIELSLKLIKNGAQDYINKGEIEPRIIEKSISYSLERNKLYSHIIGELNSRIRAENELKKQFSILDAIINNSHSVIIFLIDREYRYLGFNENHRKEMKAVYGADIETGKCLLDLITIPEIKDTARRSIDKVLNGEPFVEIQEQPGLNKYYEFHWNTVRKEGVIIGASCFILDITERMQTEKALFDSETKYRVLVETAMSGIYVSNVKGELIFANEAFYSIIGYNSLEEINSIGIGSIYQNKGDREIFIEKLSLNRHLTNYELTLTTKNGSQKTALFSAFMEDDLITGTVIDITELVEVRERAERSDRLKTAFMNNISHEIRTPLNGILGFSSLITNPEITDAEKRQFEVHINSSSERLLNTISNYIDISMIASGNVEIKTALFNPDLVLLPLRKKFQLACELNNLNFHLDIPEGDENVNIDSDPDLLQKALTHLLDNAVKFTREGEISFGYKKSSGILEFFVKDTGVGVDVNSHAAIFGNFQQEELSDTRGHEGSGLGLSISQGLIGLLGSEIKIESDKGKGATFSFRLPYTLLNEVTPSLDGISSQVTAISDPVVLVAEDDEGNMTYMGVILKKAGLKMIMATNGEEAVQYCRDHPEISLVLMDIKMPVMDGLEATTIIKSFRKNLPILAVTAFAMSSDEKQARDAGCDDYVSKPVSADKLLNKIRKYGVGC